LPRSPEDEILKYYNDFRDYFTSRPAEVRLREIVLSYKLPAGASKRDYYLARKKAMAQADEVMGKLKGGADSVALVKQYSVSESAKKDGDLGYFQPQQWSGELAQKMANLQVGQWTEPIEAKETLTIFRLEDRKPPVYVPLDDFRKDYINSVLLGRRRAEVAAHIRVKLAEAYKKDLPVEAVRKIAMRAMEEALGKK